LLSKWEDFVEYNIFELLFFLFCYSFIGWCVEVLYMAIRTGKFCNRGVLNLPLSLSYGFAMDLLLLVIPTLSNHWILQVVAYMVITSACAQMAGEFSQRLTGKKLWEQDEKSIYTGKMVGIIYAFGFGTAAWITMHLVHPILFFLCHMIPKLALQTITLTLTALVILDNIAVYYISRKRPVLGSVKSLTNGLQEQKKNIGTLLSIHIWNRLKKAYPKLQTSDKNMETTEEKIIFAQGVCLDKIIWVFLIAALCGDLIETLYIGLTAGLWLNRSSVIYGPFSIVWGVGAALLTILLRQLADKEDRYVFLEGFFLGGTYEYLCSVFTEVFFGTTFWDYSDMPFHIGGRTNLLFCVFWGALALIWVKFLYPYLSCQIEKIPPLAGKILTWIFVILMICDIIISMIAMVRYVERQNKLPAENPVEEFVDYEYPDELIEFVWPNLRIQN